MQNQALIRSLLFANFFFLSTALLALYYLIYRYRKALKRDNRIRKLAEEYRQLFDATTEGVFRSEPDGTLLLMNDGGARILGYENARALMEDGVSADAFYPAGTYRPQLLEILNERGEVENYLLRANRKDGTPFYCETTVRAIFDSPGGRIVGMDGIFRDVTRRVQMEEELRRYSENLEQKIRDKTMEVLDLERIRIQLESLAAMGRMSATIVHEIRNPLSSIKMGLTTLRGRAVLEERDKSCIELAVREMIHLERILKELLNFAKPQEVKYVRHDLNDVLELTLNQLEEEFGRDSVTIERNFASGLPRVRMDFDRISQVFMNVLLNAKQSVPFGGTVLVNTSLRPENGHVRVEFIDDGMGIREEDMERIFEPFYSTKEGGTGLGLTVVKRIVDGHMGEIRVESEPGKWTRVSIDLPLERSQSAGYENRLPI